MREKILQAAVEGRLLVKTSKYILKKCRRLWKKLKKKYKKFSKQQKAGWKKRWGVFAFHFFKPVRNLYVRRQKIVPNRIVLSSVDGKYDCNCKYIAQELLRRKLPVEIFWLVNPGKAPTVPGFPEEITVLRKGTFAALKAVATAKVWVENELRYLKPYRAHKKPGQYYLQTWHGSLGFKKIGRAHMGNQEGKRKRFIDRMARLSDKTTDYLISNSEFESNVFREAYWDTTPILMYGHCRNDILVDQDPQIRIQCKERLLRFCGLLPETGEFDPAEYARLMDAKFLLYAPTYRPGLNFENFDLDFAGLLQALREKFGGEWKVLLRYHLFNRKVGRKQASNEDFLNVTDYPDMQELMCVADAGVSDYSSWLCDFVLTKRPAFIFATDYEQYANDRGFYYPLTTTPFPICEDNLQLQQKVLQLDLAQYEKACQAFLEEKGCVEDGNASRRVVDKIVELMELSV